MSVKVKLRKRRALKTRLKIKRQQAQKGILRLQVHRSSQHIYAVILDGGKVLASANTLSHKTEGTKTEQAVQIGKILAEQAKGIGVKKVSCDRSGFKYHGRVKALVESVRNHEIEV